MAVIIITLIGATIGGILGFIGSYFSQKNANDFYRDQERKRIYREKLEVKNEKFSSLENSILMVFNYRYSAKDLNILFQRFGDALYNLDNNFALMRMLTSTYAPEIIEKFKSFSDVCHPIIDLMTDYRDVKLISSSNGENNEIIDNYAEELEKISIDRDKIQLLGTEIKIALVKMIQSNLD